MTVQNQAVSSSNGQLYTWVTASPDWTATSFPGPGSALHIAVAMAPATAGAGGGVTDHGALTGLSDVADHPWAELAARPLSSYTAASNDAVLADARQCVITTRSSAIALRIRLQSAIAWGADTLLGGINTGAGALTITAEAGVTLNGSVSVPQHGWWWAKRTASNVWQVFTGGTGGGGSGDLKSDGTVAMAADFNLGGNQATNAGDAAAATDLTTLQQVNALIAAAVSSVADWKQSVRAATTAALPTNTRTGNVLTASANGALPAQDGVTLVLNDRLLVKDEATGANRGIYTVTAVGSGGAPWTLTRATDADTNAEVTTGLTVVVEEGTANAGKPFILTTANPITVNTTALTFSALNSATAGNGLTGTSVLSVLPEDSTITVGAGGVKRPAITGDVTIGAGSNASAIANDAVTTAKILNDAVTYAKIQNVSATDRLLGRDTAAAGDIEELTVGGGIEFTGSGGIQRAALTGDVTASAGSNATTIAADAVDGTKLANSAVDLAGAKVSGIVPLAKGGDVPGVAIASPSNADTTYNISDGNVLEISTNLISGGTKNYTWAYSGTPETGECVDIFVRVAQSSDLVIKDTTGPTTLTTIVAGTKRRVTIQYNGAFWVIVAKRRLN